MSHLGKIKPSQLYIYDRFHQRVSEGDNSEMGHPQTSTELKQDFKIHLKDDGLGKYKISPLGYIKDLKELVRILQSAENLRLERNHIPCEQRFLQRTLRNFYPFFFFLRFVCNKNL